ncbi:hypothetical protein H6F73_22350 [Microcoleus sp. FACHB-68]|nr:hypothetical protein [Microcoleus sp. FACHB-68]
MGQGFANLKVWAWGIGLWKLRLLCIFTLLPLSPFPPLSTQDSLSPSHHSPNQKLRTQNSGLRTQD